MPRGRHTLRRRATRHVRSLLGKLGSLARFGVFIGLSLSVSYLGFCTLCLFLYRYVNPPVTGVQAQRWVASWFEEEPYTFHAQAVSLDKIDDDLEHAVIAAEDGRFFEHGGIDWQAIRKAVQDNLERGRAWRGGSSITQQLVKNLFMNTHPFLIRKAFEVPLSYLAEGILSKERLLELYLNVIEWDRGVFGAEAAAQRYYGRSASRLSRRQAAALAACIPNPRYRTPDSMGWYTNIILRRMQQMGW